MKAREMRWTQRNVCAECGECDDHLRCEEARQPLRPYSGIRPTSDGFDCALPISIDSHSVCSYGCLYCFAENLVQHRGARAKPIGQLRLSSVESLFSGGGGKSFDLLREALKYDDRNAEGYPSPIQLGSKDG